MCCHAPCLSVPCIEPCPGTEQHPSLAAGRDGPLFPGLLCWPVLAGLLSARWCLPCQLSRALAVDEPPCFENAMYNRQLLSFEREKAFHRTSLLCDRRRSPCFREFESCCSSLYTHGSRTDRWNCCASEPNNLSVFRCYGSACAVVPVTGGESAVDILR